MITDIRQSKLFAQFMTDLAWQVKKIDSSYVYLRKFPVIGNFAKIPRFRLPFAHDKISSFVKENKIFSLKLAPFVKITAQNYQTQRQKFIGRYKIENSPFNPTTTIYIDLEGGEKEIFNRFTPAKRRAVRKALKNHVMVKQSEDIQLFINIRKRQYRPLGFLVVSEMSKLWNIFQPGNADILLAYNKDNQPVAGILLLLYDKIAYYWYASSLAEGKKLFAPTLLVWEALKLAKKRGCQIFDFEGIYDERFPKAGTAWKGFTKFKEGFGGEKVILMENFYLKSLLI